MDQGLTSTEACKRVGINRRTGKRRQSVGLSSFLQNSHAHGPRGDVLSAMRSAS